MKLSTNKANAYKRALKSFLGYRADDHWATEFETHAVPALGRILNEDAVMQQFLQRYRISERPQRRTEVRYIVNHWLADFATHGTFS